MQLYFAYQFHIYNVSSPSDLALTDTSMNKCANATLYALALFALHAHGWPCCATSLSRSVIKLSRSWPYNTLRPNMLPPTAVVTATVTFAVKDRFPFCAVATLTRVVSRPMSECDSPGLTLPLALRSRQGGGALHTKRCAR